MDIDIRCPITGMIMADPVVAEDSIIYEKDSIEDWFKEKTTSPMTRQEIGNQLIPVLMIKNYIEDYVKKHPELKDEVYTPIKIHARYKKEIDNIIKNKEWDKLKEYFGFELKNFENHGTRKLLFSECNESILKHILDNMNDLEYKTDNTWRLIHFICCYSTPEIIKYIIDRGIYLECENKDKWRPIHYICWKSTPEMIKYIIDKGVDLECKCNYNETYDKELEDKSITDIYKVTPLQMVLKYSKNISLETVKYFGKVTENDIRCLMKNEKLDIDTIIDICALLKKAYIDNVNIADKN